MNKNIFARAFLYGRALQPVYTLCLPTLPTCVNSAQFRMRNSLSLTGKPFFCFYSHCQTDSIRVFLQFNTSWSVEVPPRSQPSGLSSPWIQKLKFWFFQKSPSFHICDHRLAKNCGTLIERPEKTSCSGSGMALSEGMFLSGRSPSHIAKVSKILYL